MLSHQFAFSAVRFDAPKVYLSKTSSLANQPYCRNPRSPASAKLDLIQQSVKEGHVCWRLGFGQNHGVDSVAGRLDHVDYIAIAPLRIGAVDADGYASPAKVEGAERFDDDGAGAGFFRGCGGVFQVQDDEVRVEGRCFGVHAGVAGRHRKA